MTVNSSLERVSERHRANMEWAVSRPERLTAFTNSESQVEKQYTTTVDLAIPSQAHPIAPENRNNRDSLCYLRTKVFVHPVCEKDPPARAGRQLLLFGVWNKWFILMVISTFNNDGQGSYATSPLPIYA